MKCENCGHENNTRTTLQNSALHLWFKQVADILNENGYDMRIFIREGIDVPWNERSFKDYIWRPAQKAVMGERSTTRLKTKDIDRIYDIINKAIGERSGLHIPFPSIETLITKD